jgi:hypothetical protein
MSSGKYLDLNNFKPEDVDINDIDTALNMTYRFNGHYKDVKPLTVAQHTYLCLVLAKMLFPDEPRVHRAVIIHDFAEAFYGDVSTPVKRMLGDKFKEFVKPIDDAVDTTFWYADEKNPDDHVRQCVKVCDGLSFDIERRTMWVSQMGKDKCPTTPDVKLSLSDKEALFNEAQSYDYINMGALLADHL